MKLICSALICLAVLVVASPAMATMYSQDQSATVGGGNPDMPTLTFTGALPAASDATLSLIATGGELNLGGKRLEGLTVDGMTFQTPGQPAGWILPVNQPISGTTFPDPVTIPLGDLSGFVADGQVDVSVSRPGFLAGGSFILRLEYTAVPEPSTLMMLALGCAVAGCRRRRQ